MAASSVGKLLAVCLLVGIVIAVVATVSAERAQPPETVPAVNRQDDPLPDKALVRIKAHEKRVYALAFRLDGNRLISGSEDGSIRLWRAATGKLERILTGHVRGVNSLVLSADGKAVLSGGNDATVLLQEVATGKQLWAFAIDKSRQQPKTDYAQVMQVDMAADGRTALALLNTNEGRLHVLDATTGKSRLERSLRFRDFRHATFSVDGKFLLGCRDRGIEPGESSSDPKVYQAIRGSAVLNVQDIATGREVFTLRLPDFNGLKHRFLPDGRMLIASTRQIPPSWAMRDTSADIRLVELASGKERLTIHVPPEGDGFNLNQFAITANGRTLAAVRSDGIVQLWDLSTGKERLRFQGSKSMARAVTFAADGKRLASGHDDGTIFVWDLTPEIDRRPGPPKPDAKTLEQWWTALSGDDAKQAHVAIWSLIATPEHALPLLHDRLRPASVPPAEKLRQLLADLDSDDFDRRKAASRELAELEEPTEPAVREVLKQDISAEQRRRLEKLLDISLVVRSPEKLRHLRALEVLEQIATPEARQLLHTMVKGTPDARLTREAKAALDRLNRRTGSPSAGK
jgi:WD40 repeat protein